MTAGTYLPAGSLNRWRAARSTAGGELVEVLCFGDSTTYGQTSGSGGVVHPWPYRLRELLGLPDGGTGIVGQSADYGLTPYSLDLPPFPARQGFADRPIYDGWDFLSTASPESVTAGDWVQFQGRGTMLRLWVTAQGGIAPTFAYSIDGGNPATVTANPNPGRNYGPVVVTGLADGAHTVRVTNVSGDLRPAADFLRSTGVVIHRAAVPGIQSDFVGVAPWHLGLATPNSPTNPGEGAHPANRRVRLAIWSLGINDQQGGDTTAAAYAANLDSFITYARNAGADPLIIVPHYEAAGGAQYAANFKAAAWNAATTRGVALVDFGVDGALGPADQWVTKGYIASLGDPHLTPLGYDTQAAYLAPVLLSDMVSSIRLGGVTRTVRAIRYGGATRTGTWR